MTRMIVNVEGRTYLDNDTIGYPVSQTTVIETLDNPVRRVYSMLVRGEIGGPLLVPQSKSQKLEGE